MLDQRDKRSVVVNEAADVDLWLAGTAGQAATLIRLSSADEAVTERAAAVVFGEREVER